MTTEPRVLIVDDDLRIIHILSTYLQMEGFAVETAMNGENALGCMAEHPPDIVILDVMLPNVDGIELCRQIRQHHEWEAIPVIMFSAKSDSGDIDAAMEAGATRYVTKPSSLQDLVTVVTEVLDGPDAAAKLLEEPPVTGS